MQKCGVANNLTIVEDESHMDYVNKAHTISIWYAKEQLVVLVQV